MTPPEALGPDQHPNDDLLLALHDGVIYSGDRPHVEAHLKACSRCRARLASLTEDITPAATATPAPPPDASPWRQVARRAGVMLLVLGALGAATTFLWREAGQVSAPVDMSVPEISRELEVIPPPLRESPDADVAGADASPAEPVPAPPLAEPAPAGSADASTTLPPAAGTPTAPPARPALVIASPNRDFRWRIVDLEVERTTNGGRDWVRQDVRLSAPITAGAAPNAAVCWLAGRAGAVFTAVGSRWREVSLPEALDLARIAALDSMNATVTAVDGRQFSTSDAGATWHRVE